MKLSAYQSQIKKMIEQRNGYLVLSSGLLILCLILSFLIVFLSGRERIVLLPPSMKNDIWISNKSASTEYLSRMTLFLAELALNVTTENVDFQQELLLRYVDPTYHRILKTQLVAEADRVKKDHITTAFFPVDLKVDSAHSDVIVTGDLKSYVGGTSLPTKRVSYHIAYRFNAFTPLIILFEEIREKEVKNA